MKHTSFKVIFFTFAFLIIGQSYSFTQSTASANMTPAQAKAFMESAIGQIISGVSVSNVNVSPNGGTVTMSGQLTLPGGMNMELQSDVEVGLSSNNAKLRAIFRNATFGQLVRGLSMNHPAANNLPPTLSNAYLEEGGVEFDPAGRAIKGGFSDSRIGSGKLDVEKSGAEANLVLAVMPPSLAQTASLIGYDDLRQLSLLGNLEVAIAFSTKDIPEENLIAGLNLGLNLPASQEIKALVGEGSLTLTAQVPSNPRNMVLTGRARAEARIGSGFTFKGINYQLKPNPQDMFIGLGGDFVVHIDGADLNFYGGMKLYPAQSMLQGELLLNAVNSRGAGGWKNPFGMPGITINRMGIAPGISPLFPHVSGAITGDLVLGTTNRPLRGQATIAIDPTAPQKSMIDASMNNISMTGIINAFSNNGVPPIMESGLSSGFRNVKFMVVPTDMTLFGRNYDRGIHLAGQTLFFGIGSNMELKIDPNNQRLYFHGSLDPINANSGGYSYLKVNGGSNNSSASVTLDVSPTTFPTARIKGYVSVMEMSSQTDIVIDKSGLSFSVGGNLFNGGFTGNVDVKASNPAKLKEANYYASVRMTTDIQRRLSNHIVGFISDQSKESRSNMAALRRDLDKARRRGNDVDKFFIDGAKQLLSTVEHTERGLRVAGEYVTRGALEQTFQIEEISFGGGLNTIRANVNATVKFRVFGSSVDETVNLNLNVANIESQLSNMASVIGRQIIREMNNANTAIARETDALISDAGPVFEEIGQALIRAGEVVGGFFANSGELVYERVKSWITSNPNEYRVEIDANHSYIDDEHTNNKIGVQFWAGNDLVGTQHYNGVDKDFVPVFDLLFVIETPKRLTHVIVGTSGNDGFYIDELRIFQGGVLIAHHGRDDGKGWCLSTDPGDAGRSWENYVAGGCNQTKKFSLTGSAAVELEYEVKIDCYHGDIDNEETSNTITVELLNGSQVVASTSKRGVNSCGWADPDEKFILKVTGPVTTLRIKTNGDNGFYIDEFRVYREGKEILHEGQDGGKGWCFSTDPGDANRSWKGYVSSSGCTASKTWNIK